jgi:ATP-dependent helicase/nuclease subunit A
MNNPANPYLSCVVEASAGSGKTHQLSERFLSLVSAGSDPAKILTITFTVKAAAEMRSRIMERAISLIYNTEQAQSFDCAMLQYYSSVNQAELSKPRPARETGELILSASQALRVSTIDSLFWEWVKKFPDESGIELDQNLGESIKIAQIKRQAWNLAIQSDESRALIRQLLSISNEYSLDLIFKKVDGLSRFESFIYLTQGNFIAPWGKELMSEVELFSNMGQALSILGASYPKYKTEVDEALSLNSLEPLRRIKLITSTLTVSGQLVKGANRERLMSEISCIETSLFQFKMRNLLAKLDAESDNLIKLWKVYADQLKQLKKRAKLVEFSDLSKGVHKIFYSENSSGATWLLSQGINHLLIDEFQDTARIQWEVFAKLSTELLSGEGTHRTVFIVGDQKQSIYGFREADPEVLNEAKDLIVSRNGQVLSLSRSYRSSPQVLGAVNDLLSEEMLDFPFHEAATDRTGKLIPPEIGGVWKLSSGKEDEAEKTAELISLILANADRFPVVGKNKSIRPVTAGDIAVLYREKAISEKLEHSLRRMGISSLREERQGFFSRSEIRDVKLLLQWLCYPHDEFSLLSFLSGPVGGFSGQDYQRIFLSDAPDRIMDYLKERKEPLYQSLLEVKSKVDKVNSELLIWELWNKLAIPDIYKRAFGGTEGELASRNLSEFLLLAGQRKGRLHDFLVWIEESSEADEVGNASLNTTGAVKLMTIHKSKGLEFPLVIVLGLGKKWERGERYWAKGEDGRLRFLPLLGDLPKGVAHEDISPFHVEQMRREIRRLIYVALTRASQYLLISSGEDHSEAQSGETTTQPSFYEKALFPQLNEEMINQLPELSKAAGTTAASAESDLVSFADHSRFEGRGKFPREIEIVSPSRRGSYKGHAWGAAQDAEFLAKAGVFFHQVLEESLRSRDWVFEQSHLDTLWSQIVGANHDEFKVEYFEMIRSSLGDSQLSKWIHSAQKFKIEAPYVRLADDKLERGSMDLVLEYPDSVQVIDYKTSDVGGAALREHAFQHGYTAQVEMYMEACRQMYPGKKIKGSIWYARYQKMLEINHET